MSGLGESRAWLERVGFTVTDEALWLEALTHGSMGTARDYQRLEFLGDRVLGLAIADWLYRREEGAEGELAQRLNALVSRTTCARIAQGIGLPEHLRLGKQARDDGAHTSDNVLGDVIEALLGANFLETSFSETREIVHDLWDEAVSGHAGRSKHPKSALQEWAAGNRRKPPEYAWSTAPVPTTRPSSPCACGVHGVGEVEGTARASRRPRPRRRRKFMEKFG